MNTFFSHMSGYLLGNNPQKVDKIRKFKLNLNFLKLKITFLSYILKFSNLRVLIELWIRLMELLYLHEIYSMNTLFSHMSGYLLRSNPHKVEKMLKSTQLDYIENLEFS